MPRNKPQPSHAKMEAADRKLRANATYDDKKGNPNNIQYDAFLKLLGGLTIGTFTFPQATETNDGEMTESKWVSTKNLVPVCPISQKNADYRHYVWLAVHMLIKVKLPHITEGTTKITIKFNQVHMTARLMDDQLIIDKNTKAIAEFVKATKQLKEKEEKEDEVPAANEQCIANRSIHFGLGNEDKGWGRPNNLRALVEHINKGMLTIKSDTVFTENDIITGLDKAGYVRKTLADPLADVSITIQNHLLTTIKGRKFAVCATGDKSVASVIG